MLGGAMRAVRESCGAVKEWIRGRHKVVREREDRATARLIIRELDDGGIWLDRDGERFRMIAKPVTDGGGIINCQLEQVSRLLQLEQATQQPRLEQHRDTAPER
jgi:hypothetical protein